MALAGLLAFGADIRSQDASPARGHYNFFVAAERGDLDELRWHFRDNNDDARAAGGYGRTALHYAAEHDRADAVEYLVSKGADVAARDHGGETPLHTAAKYGALEAAKALVRLGADVKSRHKDPGIDSMEMQSVLSDAAWSGNLELVKFLLSEGAPVVYGKDRYREDRPADTALHWACKRPPYVYDPRTGEPRETQKLAVIDLLAEKVGDINIRNRSVSGGQTPLMVAAQLGDLAIVRRLLTKYPKIEVNATSDLRDTALLLAVPQSLQGGDPVADDRYVRERAEVIRLLRDHGARADIPNYQQRTAAGQARKLGDARLLEAFGPLPPERPEAAGRPGF